MEIPGLNADVTFGEDKPVDWRKELPNTEADDNDDELSPEEKAAVWEMIGLEPPIEEKEEIEIPKVNASPFRKSLGGVKNMDYNQLRDLIKKRASQAYEVKRQADSAKPSKKQALLNKYYNMQSAIEVAGQILGEDIPIKEAEERIKALFMAVFVDGFSY